MLFCLFFKSLSTLSFHLMLCVEGEEGEERGRQGGSSNSVGFDTTEWDESLLWKQQDPIYPDGTTYWFSVFWWTTNTNMAPLSSTHPTFYAHIHLSPILWRQLMFSHCQILFPYGRYIHPPFLCFLFLRSARSPRRTRTMIDSQESWGDLSLIFLSACQRAISFSLPPSSSSFSSTILLPPSILFSYLLNGLVTSPSLIVIPHSRKPKETEVVKKNNKTLLNWPSLHLRGVWHASSLQLREL